MNIELSSRKTNNIEFYLADARRPVDPPPVLKFEIRDEEGNKITHESKNMFIVHATLLAVDDFLSNNDPDEGLPTPSRLAGTTITSLTHVRNPLPGKFLFIFNDLSIRQEGRYRLKFRMYEVLSEQGIVEFRADAISSIITAYSPKNFPGLATSSDLIKEIAQQGHRVRVRKESTLNRRRKRTHFETSLEMPISISSSISCNNINSRNTVGGKLNKKRTCDEPQNDPAVSFNQHEYISQSSKQLKPSSDANTPNLDTSSAEVSTIEKSTQNFMGCSIYNENDVPLDHIYNSSNPFQNNGNTSTEASLTPEIISNDLKQKTSVEQSVTTQEQGQYSNMIQVSIIPIIPMHNNQNIAPQSQQPIQSVTQPSSMPSDAYIFLNDQASASQQHSFSLGGFVPHNTNENLHNGS